MSKDNDNAIKPPHIFKRPNPFSKLTIPQIEDLIQVKSIAFNALQASCDAMLIEYNKVTAALFRQEHELKALIKRKKSLEQIVIGAARANKKATEQGK